MAIVRALRAAGHDVLSVLESMPTASDDIVADRAVSDGRILVTEDKDFGQILHARTNESPGVILLRYPGRTRTTIGNDVVLLVTREGEQLLRCFSVVEPGRVRIGRPRTA